jgi:hypothetical protein
MGILVNPMKDNYEIRINIRPIKYAYFLREDDTPNLIRIIQIICTQWGGIRSILVPVDRDMQIPSLYRRWLEIHEPDRFVFYFSNDERVQVTDSVQTAVKNMWPHRNLMFEWGDTFHKNDQSAHAVGMIPDRVKRSYHDLNSHLFVGNDLEKAMLLAMFGAIFPGQEGYYLRSGAVVATNVEMGLTQEGGNEPKYSHLWNRQLGQGLFDLVLNLTSYGISTYESRPGLQSNHYDLIVASSLSMTCLFWNLRATRESFRNHQGLGRRVILVPAESLSDINSLQSLIDLLRERIAHPNISTSLHLQIYAENKEVRETTESAFQRLKHVHYLKGNKVNIKEHWSSEPTEAKNITPNKLTYRFTHVAFYQHTTYFEHAGYSVPSWTPIKVGNNRVLLYPPDGFQNQSGGETAIDIVSDFLKRYPKTRRLSDRLKTSSWLSRYGLTFITSPTERAQYLDFNLPTEWDALEDFFKVKGYQIQPSQPARYAKAFIDLVGGLDALSLFASQRVMILLGVLATKKGSQKNANNMQINEYEEHPLDQPKRIAKTYKNLLQMKELQPNGSLLDLLQTLTEKNIIKRGFTIKCSNCGMSSWHSLHTIDDVIECDGCSHKFPFPVKDKEREIEWEYSLNTLANRCMDQDVLPVILTLYYLSRKQEIGCVVPGLELREFGEDKYVEAFDWVYVSNHEVNAGECKAGIRLADKDFEHARIARRSGVSNFYYSTTARFNTKSKSSVKKLIREFKDQQVTTTIYTIECDKLFLEESID